MDIEQIAGFIKPLLITFATKYPWLMAGLIVMASLRIVFKPMVSLAEGVVNITPSDADNKWLESLKKNKFYKAFVWGVDFFASLKLPKEKKG